ncbi:MAG: ATP-binding protein [Polyangiaceae bacterium]|nr:ATP-binding protein [Polyangiaceae bacterium]
MQRRLLVGLATVRGRSDSMSSSLKTPPGPSSALTPPGSHDWLAGGGAMGELIRSLDWSQTPLGPVEAWPQSLRTTVSLCLSSTFPILIAWGPERVQIYNDSYRPICGEKHPASMGQRFNECWASALPAVGGVVDRAQAGEGSYIENLRMFLERYGYLEEAFMTFSFSPIRDESGRVGGLFHPITEVTEKMLSARRTQALREIAAGIGAAKTVPDVWQLATAAYEAYALDLPFLLCYEFDEAGGRASLAASAGLAAGEAGAPVRFELVPAAGEAPWPLARALASRQIELVDDLARRFAGLACGPYPEPPAAALLLPLYAPGASAAVGCLVAGVSARRALEPAYRAFFEGLASTLVAAVASVRAYEQEQQRAAALAEIDRAKTAFFSNVSHEFRTPLTLLLGPLEEALDDPTSTDPAARARLEQALRNARRLLKLVNTLLDFTRLEAGRAQASYEPTDLAAFTADLASNFRSAVERAGMRLVVDCPPLGEPAYVDRDMWEKVILNLVSNAFKHTFEGQIGVELRAEGDALVLAVSDTGIGVPADELPNLFERFHRVRGARSRTYEGTGIGLALVQEIVRLHRGSIAAESEPGRGTTFRVRLPRGRAHLPDERVGAARTAASTSIGARPFVEEVLRWLPDATAAGARPGGESSPPAAASPASPHPLSPEAPPARLASVTQPAPLAPGAPGRFRVLLADDNADMRDYVQRLLLDYWDVEAVADGAAALAAARRSPPDLVLSDVMMPGLDGFHLIAALRGDPRTAFVPVLLLSARAGQEAALEGLAAGASDYLVKPFAARELVARVATHIALGRARAVERAARDQAEAAGRLKDEFLATISHELRTPLNAIVGWSSMLDEVRSGLAPDVAKALAAIDRNAAALTRLVEDILDVARVTTGKMVIDPRPTDLRLVVREAAESVQHAALAKGVVIELDEPGRPAPLVGDAGRLRQVAWNLFSNAIRHTDGGGRVAAHVVVKPGYLELIVRDTGRGIDPTLLPFIFDRFRQGDNAVARGHGGLGLGLSIVRSIVVDLHGGEVAVASDGEGQGATFTVRLPVAPPRPSRG